MVAAFVAHEPLLVVLGQRGRRAAETDGPRARRLLAILGAGAALAGTVGLALAPRAARLALLCPLALGGAVAWLVVRRMEKTIPGELAVAAALSSGGPAVAMAGGAAPGRALAAWATWVLAFTAATLAVHAVLERSRSRGQRDRGLGFAAAALAIVAAGFAAVPLAGLPLAAAVALLPTGALSVVLCLSPVPARRLREVGWALMGASALTMALLALGLR
jgi:hypothetical protein